jgi:sec-independent protein translocase protein TatA
MSTLLFISGPEIFIVLVVVLLLFGSKKIPELARGLGKGMSEFRKATEDIKKELDHSTNEMKKEVDSIRDEVQKSSSSLSQDDVDDQKNQIQNKDQSENNNL